METNNIPKNFIFENAGNTCYISSLLVGLFYSNSEIYNILEDDLYITQNIYIQQYIKSKIINHIRNNKSVKINIMHSLREILYNSKWLSENEIYKQQDVSEFYSYLCDIFNIEYIHVQRNTIVEALPSKDDIGNIDKIPFIPLYIPNNELEISIKQLLDNWMFDNKMEVTRTINGNDKLVNGLNTYIVQNSPQIIPLYINRFKDNNEKKMNDVIIQKRISPFLHSKNIELSKLRWSFHSAICHNGNSILEGHYYTLFISNDKWFIFNDIETPCITEVSMADKLIINKIKKECVFLLYNKD